MMYEKASTSPTAEVEIERFGVYILSHNGDTSFPTEARTVVVSFLLFSLSFLSLHSSICQPVNVMVLHGAVWGFIIIFYYFLFLNFICLYTVLALALLCSFFFPLHRSYCNSVLSPLHGTTNQPIFSLV
ncbi:hypothetical protein L873DRAFT_691602 [Choiromyces venosus 120613-1]|uniref:Uncharacterized protein n=1 Tax=Choiromyces venosus 120613-1 TaxID=1336337 RepID=A0A3N4K5H9_9PEZI|nr:hypothetical protein L873DRAFT_691602 [Choiromyces venosus 120613-1]